MRVLRSVAVAAVATGVLALSASAQTAYGDTSPTGNFATFLSGIFGLGLTPTTITFDSESNGIINPNFYPGVTFTTPSGNQLLNGAGPGQGNTFSAPLSSGEGTHAPSEFLDMPAAGSALTISFNAPVSGVGLFMLDFFNPSATNNVSFTAYNGQNGTGSVIGTFQALAYNFQPNNEYFVGFTTPNGDIQSVTLNRISDNTGDDFGVDDVTFAQAPSQTATPEPATLALLSTGLLGLAGAARRRKGAQRSA